MDDIKHAVYKHEHFLTIEFYIWKDEQLENGRAPRV